MMFILFDNKKKKTECKKPVCWDKLKEFYESVQTNPDEKPNYPNKDTLER